MGPGWLGLCPWWARVREVGSPAPPLCPGKGSCLYLTLDSDLSPQHCSAAFLGSLLSILQPKSQGADNLGLLSVFCLPGQILHPVPATKPQKGFLSALPACQPPG